MKKISLIILLILFSFNANATDLLHIAVRIMYVAPVDNSSGNARGSLHGFDSIKVFEIPKNATLATLEQSILARINENKRYHSFLLPDASIEKMKINIFAQDKHLENKELILNTIHNLHLMSYIVAFVEMPQDLLQAAYRPNAIAAFMEQMRQKRDIHSLESVWKNIQSQGRAFSEQDFNSAKALYEELVQKFAVNKRKKEEIVWLNNFKSALSRATGLAASYFPLSSKYDAEYKMFTQLIYDLYYNSNNQSQTGLLPHNYVPVLKDFFTDMKNIDAQIEAIKYLFHLRATSFETLKRKVYSNDFNNETEQLLESLIDNYNYYFIEHSNVYPIVAKYFHTYYKELLEFKTFYYSAERVFSLPAENYNHNSFDATIFENLATSQFSYLAAPLLNRHQNITQGLAHVTRQMKIHAEIRTLIVDNQITKAKALVDSYLSSPEFYAQLNDTYNRYASIYGLVYSLDGLDNSQQERILAGIPRERFEIAYEFIQYCHHRDELFKLIDKGETSLKIVLLMKIRAAKTALGSNKDFQQKYLSLVKFFIDPNHLKEINLELELQ